jgi:hypothetical protein
MASILIVLNADRDHLCFNSEPSPLQVRTNEDNK